MGFLERLRQEKEARERQVAIEKERRQKLEADLQASKEKRRTEQEARSKQRHDQAVRFYEESGLETLTAELGKLIGGISSGVDDINTILRDPDSRVYILKWDRKHILSGEFSETGKFLATEMYPDGTVVFHGNLLGLSSVSMNQWRNDSSLLEVALERAFNHPRVYKEERSNSSYFFSDR